MREIQNLNNIEDNIAVKIQVSHKNERFKISILQGGVAVKIQGYYKNWEKFKISLLYKLI